MKISVFGLGYVGCVSAACFADMGFRVIGVDVNATKVAMINRGQSPIVEPQLDGIIGRTTGRGDLSATGDAVAAIHQSDAALVCVGTPSRMNGSIDLTHIRRVTQEIGAALRSRRGYFVFVLRSTVLPGTVEQEVIPLLEEYSGKKVGRDFGVCMNPEFLREGSSVEDFHRPPKSVIGEVDTRSGDVVARFYEMIEAPTFRTTLRVAEMVKYADNAFHALKVTFANEIGSICKPLDIDSHQVMDVFVRDTKLNLSAYYLKPGFAFGGSCLPKDLRALSYKARVLDVDTPMLAAILPSNRLQVSRVASKLLDYKGKSLGFLGLSFKSGTDDLRESPLVELIETMIGKGFAVRIYDRFVSIGRLVGANKEYIDHEIPHISTLMCSSAEELMRCSDVVIVGNRSPEFRDVVKDARPEQVIVDLVRIAEGRSSKEPCYYGLGW